MYTIREIKQRIGDLVIRFHIGKEQQKVMFASVYTILSHFKMNLFPNNAQRPRWLQGTFCLDWIQWASACKVHEILCGLHKGSDRFLTCSCASSGAQSLGAWRGLAGDIFPSNFIDKLFYYSITIKMHLNALKHLHLIWDQINKEILTIWSPSPWIKRYLKNKTKHKTKTKQQNNNNKKRSSFD